MAGESTSTVDHDEIRGWAERRGGRPATVARTHSEDDAGVIRIDFPDYSRDDALEEISWDQWFAKFEENQYAFVYQETTADGDTSNFNRLVKRGQ